MTNLARTARASLLASLALLSLPPLLTGCSSDAGDDGGAAGGAQGGAGGGGGSAGTGGAAGEGGSAAGGSSGAAGGGGAGAAGSAAGGASGGGGAGAAGGTCAGGVAPSPGVVVTDRGAVKGAIEDGIYSYKNIPFAAPPVGELRWKPPQPAACWEGVRDGTQWGNICPQLDNDGKPVGDEDCLTLNVWAPDGAASSPRPVLVWIHGGGFVQGGAAEQVAGKRFFDAHDLAKRSGAVVVTIDYRVGALGYLAHPSLTAEGSPKSSGNYGVLDQQAALGWVKSNIAAFGGDPSHVTITGESAGGASVCTLVASPLSAGLFSAAIMQSGGCVAHKLSEGEDFGGQVFAAAGCSSAPDPLSCMRALPADKVITALPVSPNVAGKAPIYGGYIDGHVLGDTPQNLIAQGKHNHVPMIVGNCADETSRTVPDGITTEQAYADAVKLLFPADGMADKILAEYPAKDYPTPRAAYVALTTDAKFVCGGRRALSALSKSQTEPVYRFIVTLPLENAPKLKPFGAFHGIDVIYMFGTLYDVSGYTPSPSALAVTSAMQGYWGQMAASGAPSGGGLPAWPAWSSDDPYLELGTTITTGQGFHKDHCDFWDQLLAQ